MKGIDDAGAVFVPSPERNVITPCYTYGHGKIRKPVFTCPVSAIPEAVWELFDLWLQGRALKLPPVAGGLVDQPEIVRRAWPVFEHEMAPFDQANDPTATLLAAMTAMFSIGKAPTRS